LKLPKDQWPPNQPSSIVSVALIHYKNQRTQQELIEISERFKEGAPAIDKLALQSRVTKDINKVFSADYYNEIPKCILIEGAPGIGKTILAKEIAYLWAKGELLQNCNLLFLVHLRDPQLHKVKEIKELIQLYCNERVAAHITEYLESNKGDDVAFVFDGFDELPSNLQQQSLITQIIEREGLGRDCYKATVVVTSRPTATLSLYHVVDRRVEILGFSKEERDKYISLSIESGQKEKLYEYLNQHPIINGFCFIPLYLAILLFLFHMDSLPNTLTDMNEYFVVHSIYRQLNKLSSHKTHVIKNIKDLPADVYEFVKKLSELAYKGLKKNQLVFSYDEIKEVCPEIDDMPGAFNGFGLLQAVQHYIQKGAGTTTSFNFLHFTMQEYLAAFHVSNLPEDLQSLKMKMSFWDGKYSFMWMMYVGIVGVHSSVFISFLSDSQTEIVRSKVRHVSKFSLSDSIRNDKRKCLHLFQCYMEAKSDKIPEIISSIFKAGKIKLTGITLLPHHISSLIFFMSTSITQNWEILELENCNLRCIGMNSLLEHVAKNEGNMSTLTYVDLNGNGSSPWGVYCAITRHGCVDSLTLCGDDGMEEYVEGIIDSVNANATLKTLTLFEIGRTGVKTVSELLDSSLYLIVVNLSCEKIKFERIKNKKNILLQRSYKEIEINILYDELYSTLTQSIELKSKSINDDAAAVLAFGLCNNTTVQKLDISCNEIFDDGVGFISDALMNNNCLQELNISENLIGVEGACKIAKLIQHNTALCKLDVSSCGIPFNGVVVISKCLKSNTTLQEINISGNNAYTTGAKAVAELVKVNSTLLKLDISSCKTSSIGVEFISESYKNNKTLQQLRVSLYGNNVTLNITYPICNLSRKVIRHTESLVISNILCNSNIKELNISHGNMSDDALMKICNSLETNNSLQALNMSYTKITNVRAQMIAEVIKVNTTLKTLNISYCNIPDGGAVDISYSYKCNETLQELIISWNNDQVHVNTADLYSVCDFSRKNIGDAGALIISNLLYNKQAIQKLYISHCSISDSGVVAICDWLKNTYTLQEIDISGNTIASNGASKIAEVIQDNVTLQKLNISFCDITSDGAVFISECLKNNNSLQELNMSHNKFISDGVYKIAEIIQGNTVLKKLDISYCGIPDDGAVVISESYKNNKTPQELIISWNDDQATINTMSTTYDLASKSIGNIGALIVSNLLGDVNKLNISHNKISDGGIIAISTWLNNNSSLQELDMTCNEITILGANKIAEAIQVNTTLRKLDISYCGIPDDGAVVISESYKNNQTLQELIISWRCDEVTVNTTEQSCNLNKGKVGNTGALVVSNLFRNRGTVRTLQLSNNNISDDGLMAISDYLVNDDTLKVFKMAHNNISLKGANMISKIMQSNTRLQTLDISYCGITDDGVVAFSDCLKNNNTLQELILPHNNILLEGANAISKVIRVNTTLQKLDISHCNIPDEGVILISESCKNNTKLQKLKISWNNDIVTVSTADQFWDLSDKDLGNNGTQIVTNILLNKMTVKNVRISQKNMSKVEYEKLPPGLKAIIAYKSKVIYF